VLFASLALILLYVFWQPLPTILWSAPLMTVGHIFFPSTNRTAQDG
jgi:hypothetical protein